MRQINLLPDTLQKAAQKKTIVNSLLVLFGSTFLMLFLCHVLLSVWMAKLQSKIEHPPAYLDSMEFVQSREHIKQIDSQIKTLLASQCPIIEPYINNILSVDILAIVGKISRHKVWFTSFALNHGTKICEIEGKSINTRLVSEFLLGFKKIPYFSKVDLISMEKGVDEKIDFKIRCILK